VPFDLKVCVSFIFLNSLTPFLAVKEIFPHLLLTDLLRRKMPLIFQLPYRQHIRRLQHGGHVESWRFGRVFDRYCCMKLDAGEQNRYKSQFRWFIKKVEEALEQAELRIVNVEGHPFDPGMAATPLNIEEFDAKDALMVDQMLEPIIMGKEGLVKTGTVTLRKVEL
jgi:hypothetical protein